VAQDAALVALEVRVHVLKVLGGSLVANCCNIGEKLTKEYDNALGFEAICYGRLIAHKNRHAEVGEISRVRHMRMVIQAAKEYAEGDVDSHAEVPPAYPAWDQSDGLA